MPRLTERSVKAARCPAGVRDKTIWDDLVTGFGLRVRPSGARTFVVRYVWRGQKKRYTLGTPELLAVEGARDKARQALLDVLAGKDPVTAARDLVEGPTVAQLADLYLAKQKDRSRRTFASAIENHIKPKLGHLPVAAVQDIDCSQAIAAVIAGPKGTTGTAVTIRKRRIAGGQSIARLVHGTLVSMFQMAERAPLRWRPRNSNPMAELEQPNPKGRRHHLSIDDYARLGEALRYFAATRTQPPGALLAFWLLALSGARRDEIRFAPLKGCDTARQTIHMADSKTGERLLLLGAVAAQLIAERVEAERAVAEDRFDADGVNWLIAPLGRKVKPVHLWNPWVAVRTRAGLPKLRLHDLRHGFTSLGNEIGEPYPLLMALLGHSAGKSGERIKGLPGTTAEYLHVGFDAARGAADRIAQAIWNAMNRPAPAPAPTQQPLPFPPLLLEHRPAPAEGGNADD